MVFRIAWIGYQKHRGWWLAVAEQMPASDRPTFWPESDCLWRGQGGCRVDFLLVVSALVDWRR